MTDNNSQKNNIVFCPQCGKTAFNEITGYCTYCGYTEPQDDNMSDEEQDLEWTGLYGGDPEYCRDCGARLHHTADGNLFCPNCDADPDLKESKSNELEKRAKFHKKHQRGLSPFCSLDAGNVEHNIETFNTMNNPTESPSTSITGPMSESLNQDELEVNIKHALSEIEFSSDTDLKDYALSIISGTKKNLTFEEKQLKKEFSELVFATEEDMTKFIDRIVSEVNNEKDTLTEGIEVGTIVTYCPECGKLNHVKVQFKDFNTPFDDAEFTCCSCGAKCLVTDEHKYNKDGTITESVSDKKDPVVLEYDRLHVEFDYGTQDWNDGSYSHTFNRNIPYSYYADYDTIFQDLLDLEFESNETQDMNEDELNKYVEDNFDALVEKYYKTLLEIHEEDAIDAAYQEIDPETYDRDPDTERGGHDDID